MTHLLTLEIPLNLIVLIFPISICVFLYDFFLNLRLVLLLLFGFTVANAHADSHGALPIYLSQSRNGNSDWLGDTKILRTQSLRFFVFSPDFFLSLDPELIGNFVLLENLVVWRKNELGHHYDSVYKYLRALGEFCQVDVLFDL